MASLCTRWWTLVFNRAEKLRACERNLGFALERMRVRGCAGCAAGFQLAGLQLSRPTSGKSQGRPHSAQYETLRGDTSTRSLWCASISDHPVMKTPHRSADTPTALRQRGADPANHPPGCQTRHEIKARPAF
ncbi:hypothetical protein CDAR_396611 [Caerostris darwini]|uniref:Uncharacterized protein n=1 Tax=Caerostris darwini TaxID=1538125 RepID=A0AAV4PQQ5_9ARAC|nr:hypothetical protein CDAR_396611 [Caerostris darwini]